MPEFYEVRVRGLLGPIVRLALGNPRCRPLPRQSTIRGRLSEKELERLLTTLDGSGVEVLCLNLLPAASPTAGDLPAPDSGRQSDLTGAYRFAGESS
jgi:hypothetical protein